MIDKILEYATAENIQKLIIFICSSGFVIEFVPAIKLNPVSALLGWIGKKLNKEVKDEISKINVKVDTVQSDLQDHKVESWRREILNFADSLSYGKCKGKEQFQYIISLHDNYEKYIEERKLTNGQMNAAFSYIMKCYNECLENNSFFTGK